MANITLTATGTPYAVTNSTTRTGSSTLVNTASSTSRVSSTASTTPSASTTSVQGANVANSKNTATVSASTTSAYGNSATNNTSKVVSSTTPSTKYAYLSHMGTNALREIEDALIILGYDNKDDGEIIDSLTKFKNHYGMNSYDVYSSEVIDKLEEVYKNGGLKIYVTKEKLEAADYENVTDEMVKSLNIALNKYNITSQNEINHFLAQCRVESWYGKALTEKNWDNIMDDVTHFNQKYSGRTDLGNNGGNDGYTYRGAGYIQLTGKGNYELFAASVCDNKILELGADYVAENYAWEAAAWFWTENVHSLFEGGNEPSVSDVTKIINKRQNHLAEREAAYKQLIENDC